MFDKTAHDFPLPERQLRHLLAVRIAMVLLAFFSAAYCLLQWTLATEPRFMAEGVARQFVTIEAAACALVAAGAFVFMVGHGLGWIAVAIQMRRRQNGAARQREMQRLGAYV